MSETDCLKLHKAKTEYILRLEAALAEKESLAHDRGVIINAQLDQIAALQKWKDETLEVEASWDCQAVGKAIGTPLGGNIRKDILPFILKKDKIINVFTYLLLHHGIISRGKASSVIEIDRSEIDEWMEKKAEEWKGETSNE